MDVDFNADWQFQLTSDAPYVAVRLPHTPREEQLLCDRPYTGICRYKKIITAPAEWSDRRVALRFGAAMHTATVYLNGEKIACHVGGYLPFTVALKNLKYGEDNVLEVVVDNRENGDVPPGKPVKTLDFLYYGGIYRDVTLIVTDKTYISDPIAADVVGGGGVSVVTEVLSDAAAITADVYINNERATRQVELYGTITDATGNIVATARADVALRGYTVNSKSTLNFSVKSPNFWSPMQPYLYDLKIAVIADDREVDAHCEILGIRTVVVNGDGMFLNGKPFTPFGTNRHQQHPYIGLAASADAERREARLLKQAGYNTLRLAHYPQSDAFLDECARVGMFVIDCIPGWQFCRRGKFRKTLLQNVKDTVRRDRNNPAVLCYETSLNETPFYFSGASDRFFRKLCATARAEHPKALVSGDLLGRRLPRRCNYDIPYPLDYDNGEAKRVTANRTLVREYGDWGFGGNESTSRVRRCDGDRALQLQAWNFQWTHNKNIADKNNFGDLYWEGIDHIRGYYHKAPMSCSGALDIFRLPKFSYYFFKSQRTVADGAEPMIFAAVTDLAAANDLIVYTNTDEVTVEVDGTPLGRFHPDNGATAWYVKGAADKTDVAYWLNGGDFTESTVTDSPLAKHSIACFHDGGNCETLSCPPVTVKNFKCNGRLVVKGFIDGKQVAEHIVIAPKAPTAVKIEVADRGLALKSDGVDFVYCYVKLIDSDGNPCFNNGVVVHLDSEGGSVVENDRITECGIAAFVLRASAATVTIKAVADCGADGVISLKCRD